MTREEMANIARVSRKTISEWLRGKGPLHPDQARKAIHASMVRETFGEELGPALLALGPGASRWRSTPREVQDLLDLIRPDAALEPLARLPRGYMERYQERVRDVEQRLSAFAVQLQRELDEYRQLLLAESRQPKKP